jgi:hypothetical protein
MSRRTVAAATLLVSGAVAILTWALSIAPQTV